MPQGQHPAGSGSAQLPGCRPSGQNAPLLRITRFSTKWRPAWPQWVQEFNNMSTRLRLKIENSQKRIDAQRRGDKHYENGPSSREMLRPGLHAEAFLSEHS